MLSARTVTGNASEAAKAWQGQIVDGRFPLRRWLGGSEHSFVFLTDGDGREFRRAAIKLVAAQNKKDQLARWAIAGQLSHPNLVRVFHSGHCRIGERDLIYVITEYAEEDLSQILPQRPLSPSETGDMLPPLMDALGYLHGKGLVHGQIRPSNIMAVADQLKLSTDNLWSPEHPYREQQEPSIYEAPEFGSGRLSAATDVWSMGLLLVAALTQYLPPWERAEHVDPQVPESVPEPFGGIARRCLRVDATKRASLAEIAGLLKRDSAEAPSPASVPLKKPSSRWRPWVVVLAALLLVAVVALWLGRGSRARPAQRTVEPNQAGERATSPPPAAVPAKGVQSRGEASDEVRERVLPNVPRSARNTIRGKIKVVVRVEVNPSGDVSSARPVTPGPSRYFANLAVNAARNWKFAATQAGSQWLLRFQFARTSTQATPIRVSP